MMSDIIHRLNALGDSEHDDLEIAHEAAEEIIALRLEVARLSDELEQERERADELGYDKQSWYSFASILAEKLAKMEQRHD